MNDEAYEGQQIGSTIEDLSADRLPDSSQSEKKNDLNLIKVEINSFFQGKNYAHYTRLRDLSDKRDYTLGSREDYVQFEDSVYELLSKLAVFFQDASKYKKIMDEITLIWVAVDDNRAIRKSIFTRSHDTEIQNIWKMFAGLDIVRTIIENI